MIFAKQKFIYILACILVATHLTHGAKKKKQDSDEETEKTEEHSSPSEGATGGPMNIEEIQKAMGSCLESGMVSVTKELANVLQKIQTDTAVQEKVKHCMQTHLRPFKDPNGGIDKFCASLDKSFKCLLE